jgi:hypothetical protein
MIQQELMRLRNVAAELRLNGVGPHLTNQLNTESLSKLFDWSHRNQVPSLRNAVYELMRLCIRLNRECTLPTDAPFDPEPFADRLDELTIAVAQRLPR